jgi:hypothetical protein
MTTEDGWNLEHAWAEQPQDPAGSQWPDAGGSEWAEDIRSGAAWQMQGHAPPSQQSGLGMASLVLSLIAGAMLGIPLVGAVMLFTQNPNLVENDPRAVGLGCAMLVGMVLALLAGLLGLIGLFQPDRARTCALLGVLFAGIEVFGMAGLLVLGLTFG